MTNMGSRCDEITRVTWIRRLQDLICGVNNFVLYAFLYLVPVQRSKNMVRIGGWELQQQHEQEHYGRVEGTLTAI